MTGELSTEWVSVWWGKEESILAQETARVAASKWKKELKLWLGPLRIILWVPS